MKKQETIALLQELIRARGPAGEEDEVRTICEKWVCGSCDEHWIDAAGNLIAHIKGKKRDRSIRVMAHIDELAMIVKRINDNGSLRVDPIGGIFPFDIGQGPVEILGDQKVLPGILSAQSTHTSDETGERWRLMPHGENRALRWRDMNVFTGMTTKELEKVGVHAGTRVVMAQSRRNLFPVGDFLGGFFMDNRVAVLISLLTIMGLKKKKPNQDVYFVFTTEEEIGAHGASYAARTLPGEIVLAIDVGPVAEEYNTELNEHPIIVYQDSFTVYHKGLSDQLLKTAKSLKFKPQCATWSRYGSDASVAKRHGQTAQAALICIPTKNTHGFEIIHCDGPSQCAKLLTQFL